MAMVIQADRDAAAEFHAELLDDAYAAGTRAGKRDGDSDVQRFAAHREASTARLEADKAVLLRIGASLLATSEIKWGNLDESVNEIHAEARAEFARIQGDDASNGLGGGHAV